MGDKPKARSSSFESRIKVYIEEDRPRTIQQSRQFPAVTLRQVFSGRANLLFNKIEVIEQPFAGRRTTAAALIASVKRFMLLIYIIITDCYLEGFSQPAGAYTVFKLFKVKLILVGYREIWLKLPTDYNNEDELRKASGKNWGYKNSIR